MILIHEPIIQGESSPRQANARPDNPAGDRGTVKKKGNEKLALFLGTEK
jgi:hypothetical protein